MKGFKDSSGKFHPITDYKGVRKSRDQKAKTKGVQVERKHRYRHTLNENEVMRLEQLGDVIEKSLSCNINDSGIPCRTDRLEAVRAMEEYLAIHDIGTRKARDSEVEKDRQREREREIEEQIKGMKKLLASGKCDSPMRTQRHLARLEESIGR